MPLSFVYMTDAHRIQPIPSDFKVVGAFPYMNGHIVKCLMPIYEKAGEFFHGYYGTKGFGSTQNPYHARERGQTQVLILPEPTAAPGNVTVGAFASLESLEQALAQVGIEKPFKLDSVFADEVVQSDYADQTCRLRFGDQYQISAAFLDYSEKLTKIAEERLRKHESLDFIKFGEEPLNLLRIASALGYHSLASFYPELERKADNLLLTCHVLQGVNDLSSPIKYQRTRTFFRFTAKTIPGNPSWEQYEGLVKNKAKELGLNADSPQPMS